MRVILFSLVALLGSASMSVGQDVRPGPPPDDLGVGWWTARQKVRGDNRLEIAKSIADLRDGMTSSQLTVFNAGVEALNRDARNAAGKAAVEMALSEDQAYDYGYVVAFDGIRVSEILERGRGAIMCARKSAIEEATNPSWHYDWEEGRSEVPPQITGERAETLKREAVQTAAKWGC